MSFLPTRKQAGSTPLQDVSSPASLRPESPIDAEASALPLKQKKSLQFRVSGSSRLICVSEWSTTSSNNNRR